MYQFLNTRSQLSVLISQCNLLPLVGLQGMAGSAQTYGEDWDHPDVIHFYREPNPKVSDPYRLFILEKTAFKYKEIF